MSTPGIARKDFWKKPEGTTGGIVLFALIAMAVLVGWFYLLPVLITLLANTIIAFALAAVLVTMFIVATNKHFQIAVSHLFKRSMYKLTDAIIVIDPIGVLRNRVDSMKERINKMAEVEVTLNKQIKITRQNIQKNKQERERAVARSESTKDKYDYFLQSRQAGRLERSTISSEAWLQKMEAMYRLVKKYIELTTVFAKDTEAEANIQEQDRKQLLANYNVYKAAQKAMQGQEDELDMFNRALDHLVQDREAKFAEVDSFVDMIDGVVSGMDMEAGVFDQDAVTNFEVWERKADSLLLGPGEQNRFLSTIDAVHESEGEKVPVAGTTRRSYADMFGKKNST